MQWIVDQVLQHVVVPGRLASRASLAYGFGCLRSRLGIVVGCAEAFVRGAQFLVLFLGFQAQWRRLGFVVEVDQFQGQGRFGA
ncbi:hypothetical protein D3C80_1537010 [compost metagenome]